MTKIVVHDTEKGIRSLDTKFQCFSLRTLVNIEIAIGKYLETEAKIFNSFLFQF